MTGKVSTFSGPSGLFQATSATPSLVLSLDASKVLSYSGTGLTWSDLTIFNNNVVFTTVDVGENPTYSVSGGGSFQFGDDSFVLSATSNGFPLGDSHYTIETWINPDNLSQTAALVVYGTLGENSANSIGLSNSSIFVDWVDNNLFSPTQSMIPGNWYYLSSTYNGTDRKIYLNGSLIASDTPGVTHSITTGDTFTIGSIMGQPFTGKISIVKLHTKALSAPKLLSNFNSLKNRFGYTFGSMTFGNSGTSGTSGTSGSSGTRGTSGSSGTSGTSGSSGIGSSYLTTSSSDYVFGREDFTVEAFFKAATSSNITSGIVSLRKFGENGVSINTQMLRTSELSIEFNVFGGKIAYTASNDQWYHVAISKTGGTSSFFVNGNLLTSVDDYKSLYGNVDLVVGRYYTDYNGYYFNGIISNVRVINGTGLYTGTFSIPSTPLSGDEPNTKLLISSQEMNPTADLTGLHSITASNIGWTSSLPSIVAETISINLFFNRITTLTQIQIDNIAQDVPTIKLLRYLSTGEIAQTTSIIANNTYEYDGLNQFSTTIDETTFLNALIDGEYYIFGATSNYLVGYQPQDPYQISGGGYFLKWNSSTGLFTSSQNSSPGPGATFSDYNPGDSNYRSFNPSSTIIGLLGSLPKDRF